MDEIYPFWLQTRMSKEMDGMPLLNRGLVDSMVKTFYPKDSEVLLKIFFECGVFFQELHKKMRFKDLDEAELIHYSGCLFRLEFLEEMDRTER